MTQLTKSERDTLNAAFDIIAANTPNGATWMPSFRRCGEGYLNYDVTYFTRVGEQHGWLHGETFADKVQAGIDMQAAEDAEGPLIQQRRIDRLRKELAELTGESAA
jgi:hypothetical protein